MKYFIRRITTSQYEMSKFADHAEPEVMYKLTNRGSCDCPAGSHGRSCKHTGILNSWIDAGANPFSYYDEETPEFVTLDVTDAITRFLDKHGKE